MKQYRILFLILVFIVALLVFSMTDDNIEAYKIKESRCGGYDRSKINGRKPYKIVSSFTTSPSRIDKTDKTLYSLKEQTYPLDYILLNIPEKFARTNESYTIPNFIKKDKQIVINKIDKDYGPATKLVGAILRIPKDEDVWIVVHDDDQMYLQETINEYTKYIDGNDQNKKICYTVSGFAFDKNYNVIKKHENFSRLQVAEGFTTFCVHRSLFEDDFIPYINDALTNKDAFQSDDLIISNYIAKKGVSIYLINNKKVNISAWWALGCELEHGLKSDALHQIARENGGQNDPLGGHYKKYLRVVGWLKNNNNYYMT